MENKKKTPSNFWDTRDKEERNNIIKLLPKTEDGGYFVDADWNKLPDWQKELLTRYFKHDIQPQKGKQQLKYDGVIEENLPETFKCPVCSSPVKQVVDKRGIYWKCQNKDCGWDSARPFDWNTDTRKRHIVNCARDLKHLFPQFNFVTNFPYSPGVALTGKVREGKINYDIGVFFFGNKLQRIRMELNQNLTKEQFYKSDFCYVVGIPSVVDYLAKRRGLVVHYLVDEEKEKILISRMDKVVEHCPMKLDKFGNRQYFIPKQIRPLIVTDNFSEIQKMLYANLYKEIYKNIEIL